MSLAVLMTEIAAPFTIDWWLGNVADCLKVRLHNKLSTKQRTGLIIAFLAIIISFTGHSFVKKNSPDVVCWRC